MGIPSSDESTTIVVIELEPEIVGYLRDWRDIDDEIRMVDSIDDVHDALDMSVDIVIAGNDVARPMTANLVRAKPYLGPLAMVIDDPEFELEELPVDLYIETPISSERIIEATEKLLLRVRSSTYERELLSLISEQLAKEDEKHPIELESDPGYQLLLDEIADRLERLDIEVTNISSKYRPPACSNCGLRWDRKVGDTVGFVRISSFSWRCVECGEVVPNVNPFDRSVARR